MDMCATLRWPHAPQSRVISPGSDMF